MKRILSCLSIATFAAATLCSVPPANASPAAAPHQEYGQGNGQEQWAQPPAELQGAERQGFHDGIEGARRDAQNNRPPNVENREEYRHPPVPHEDRAAYRHGFRHGYHEGMEHLMRHDHDHDGYR